MDYSIDFPTHPPVNVKLSWFILCSIRIVVPQWGSRKDAAPLSRIVLRKVSNNRDGFHNMYLNARLRRSVRHCISGPRVARARVCFGVLKDIQLTQFSSWSRSFGIRIVIGSVPYGSYTLVACSIH